MFSSSGRYHTTVLKMGVVWVSCCVCVPGLNKTAHNSEHLLSYVCALAICSCNKYNPRICMWISFKFLSYLLFCKSRVYCVTGDDEPASETTPQQPNRRVRGHRRPRKVKLRMNVTIKEFNGKMLRYTAADKGPKVKGQE